MHASRTPGIEASSFSNFGDSKGSEFYISNILQVVIGQFVIGQFNKPIKFKVVV